MSGRLGMVMYNLQKIMLGILKYHKNALVLQNYLDELNDVGMAQLRAQCHLTDRGLRDTRVLDLLALLIRLKFLDGKLASLAVTANGFVNSAIRATANEPNDLVAVDDPNFTLITGVSRPSISRI